jgi:hypothetical protein
LNWHLLGDFGRFVLGIMFRALTNVAFFSFHGLCDGGQHKLVALAAVQGQVMAMGGRTPT